MNNRKNLKHVRTFAELRWLKADLCDKLPLLMGSSGVCPERLIIIIAHSDWKSWWAKDWGLSVQDTWIEKLLNHPALPLLRQVRIEFETPKQNLVELDPIIAFLRQKYSKVKRVDHFGYVVCVEMQESPPAKTWSAFTNSDANAPDCNKDMEQDEYHMVTLVWKVTSKCATASHDFQLEEKSGGPAQTLNPPLSSLGIDYPDFSRPKSSMTAEEREVERCTKRWTLHMSLLKFGPAAPTLRVPTSKSIPMSTTASTLEDWNPCRGIP